MGCLVHRRLSLSMNICAQTRQEGGRVRCASPIIFLFPMVPCASSPITCLSLAFPARLCAKKEAVKTRTLIVGHPSQHARRKRKEILPPPPPPGDKQKTKAITILSYKNRIHLQKCNCGHFLTNPSLDQLLTTIGHKTE